MSEVGLTAAEREAEARQLLANVFRDWIHGTTLSQCSMGADTCPDWPLANHLADLACDALKRRFGGGERGPRCRYCNRTDGQDVCPDSPEGYPCTNFIFGGGER